MPASLPGSTKTENLANPNAGQFVIFDPLSGPKGSPLDVRKISYAAGANTPTYTNDAANQNPSTGALSTGIGIGANTIVGGPSASAPINIFRSGWNDNMVPGKKVLTYAAAPAVGVVATDAFDSTILYIGGGRMIAGSATDKNAGRPFIPSPYTAGVVLMGAGNGGSRDAGAGPIFTGFPMKMVTATATVANAAAIETGFVNRSGVSLVAGQSAFGSDAAATVAPSLAEAPEGDALFSPPPFFTPEPQPAAPSYAGSDRA